MQLARNSELLLPSPSWVSYAPQAGVLGLPVTWIPTEADGRWSPTPDALAHACATPSSRPRLLVLNSPPTPRRLATTPQLARARRGRARPRSCVLSDEIYGELHHDGGTSVHRPPLSRRDHHHRRAEQVVRRRRLAAGTATSRRAALAARRRRRAGERDVFHCGSALYNARQSPPMSGAMISTCTSSARGASSPRWDRR